VNLKNKSSILIVGANGIIGSFLRTKLSNDYQITSISKNSDNNEVYSLDLSDSKKTNNYFKNIKKFDCLIFLVGRAHKKGKRKDLFRYEKTNFKTLKNVISSLDKFSILPKKIIFTSTVSVYGEQYDNDIYNENSIVNPQTPYAVTKLMAEEYLMNNYSERTWILRLAPVYSSDFQLNIDRRTKISKVYYKPGNGKSKLSLCNIKNINFVVREIILGQIPHGIYNLSDSRIYSYNDLLKYKKIKIYLKIPRLIIVFVGLVGRALKNQFLIENSTKLLTNNIYPAKKLKKFVEINEKL
tara:strand:+ start:803 stop:1693 length:891 start_codon:yes stop_codon:yes gene_type:complete